jgi:hypothetical protein
MSHLREELLRRRDADQEARVSVPRGVPNALANTMRIDDENAVWLREVVTKFGWPGRSLVGDDGAHAAWLLAQHADRDPALQKHCLILLEQAVVASEAEPRDLAFLTDRVRLASGLSQIYGTQMTPHDGRFAACRLADPEAVDERRASVGLEPLNEYLNRALELYGPPSPARMICPNCSAEIEVWLPEPGARVTVECASCHSIWKVRPAILETREPSDVCDERTQTSRTGQS